MYMQNANLIVDVSADTSQFDAAMKDLTEATQGFGQIFSSTISRSIKSGKNFEDTIRSIGRRFADLALNQALKPVEDFFSNFLGSVVAGAGTGISGTSIPGFANGSAFSNGSVMPFARGGVVSSPTPFNFGSRLGVMGEAGPEAIMPLSRGADGKLGVAAQSGNAKSVNVVFNVTTNDAASFKKSEGQITTMLARAVARGQRGL